MTFLVALFALAACASDCTRVRNRKQTGAPEAQRAAVEKSHPAPTAAQPVTNGPLNARSSIGYNLDFPGDWTWATPFLDLMHDARPWVAGDEPPEPGELVLDERGYPKTLGKVDGITAVVHTGDSPEFVGHTWVLTYDGKGQLDIDGGIEVLSRRPGRITFRGGEGNVWITIAQTDPEGTGDYIRNVRVFRADREHLVAAGKIFNPDFLEFLAPFGSLRFMDWMQSNERDLHRGGKWSERATTEQTQWRVQYIDPSRPERGTTVGGYPVEVMVALANEAGADPHFNMPYNFEDEFAREFAKVVRDQLAPNLNVTVEYSNEVWNWAFPQATYARLKAEKLWPGEGSGWLQYMGVRASQMCKIWKDVFAGELSRLRCVIAPQTGWPGIANASLDCPKWVEAGHEPCHKAADAIAITGYFSGRLQTEENTKVIHSWLAKGKDYALDRAFRQLMNADVAELTEQGEPAVGERAESLPQTLEYFRVFKQLADERDLELYVYEGGTHFNHGEDEKQKAFLLDVVRDDRMALLYKQLFQGFREAGGTIFNVWGGIGEGSCWANARDLHDRSHPKYRAIIDFVKTHPCNWPNCDRTKRVASKTPPSPASPSL